MKIEDSLLSLISLVQFKEHFYVGLKHRYHLGLVLDLPLVPLVKLYRETKRENFESLLVITEAEAEAVSRDSRFHICGWDSYLYR